MCNRRCGRISFVEPISNLMPILKREADIFPQNLFENEPLLTDESLVWWCIYTMSRREKDFMRRLTAQKIAHYGPVIPKRYRSPNGRLRTSFVPLFPNYVFMLGGDEDRVGALTTNCVSRCEMITDRGQLLRDLRQINAVISADVPLTPEAKLESGNHVRVRGGPFAGYEGTVIRREGKTRLLLTIQFLAKGVSMELDEALLEPIS